MRKGVWFALLVWASAGTGTVVGSILGSPGGQRWLFAGAILGGALALPFAVTNLHTPVVPVLSSFLIALGALRCGFRFDGQENFRLPAEALMRRHGQVASAGFVLRLPALLLVSSAPLGLEPPAALVTVRIVRHHGT